MIPALALLNFCKFSEIDENSNYGALLEGTRFNEEEKSKWILLLPAFFFGRRIALTLSVLLFPTFLWAQVAIQFAVSTAMVIYLLHVWPLKTHFATKMEVFNECTLIILNYGLMMFTDFVPDTETRFLIGWFYMIVSLGNIAVHLSILIGGSTKQCQKSCRRKYLKSKRNVPEQKNESAQSQSKSQSESQS